MGTPARPEVPPKRRITKGWRRTAGKTVRQAGRPLQGLVSLISPAPCEDRLLSERHASGTDRPAPSPAAQAHLRNMQAFDLGLDGDFLRFQISSLPHPAFTQKDRRRHDSGHIARRREPSTDEPQGSRFCRPVGDWTIHPTRWGSLRQSGRDNAGRCSDDRPALRSRPCRHHALAPLHRGRPAVAMLASSGLSWDGRGLSRPVVPAPFKGRHFLVGDPGSCADPSSVPASSGDRAAC